MHQQYHEAIRARAKGAVEHARAVQGVNHPGLRGRMREIFVREILAPLLPSDVGIGSGKIIGRTGGESRETDLVLFDRRIVPAIVVHGDVGLFPMEGVLYTIEVKSRISRSDIKSAHDGAQALSALWGQGHSGQPPRAAVFAFDSTLAVNGKSEVTRYQEVLDGEAVELSAMCVVGRGYWFYDDQEWVQPEGRTGEAAEVVGFVAGVLNRYGDIAASRTAARAGEYLFDD